MVLCYRAAGCRPRLSQDRKSRMTRRSLTAALATAALTALLLAGTTHAAIGDLPRLTEGAPANTERFWFDDHSVIGDNHLSWSPAGGELYYNDAGQASQREPQGIRSDSVMGNSGPGALEVCGYPAGVTGWMRAYQAAPGTLTTRQCPADEPTTGQFGWFRYVFGRHSETNEFNRWHLLDVERSALVPLPGTQTGSVPTV